MPDLFRWTERHREYAAVFIRLAVGTRLIEGTQDNVFSSARMQEFVGFLAANGTPYPEVGVLHGPGRPSVDAWLASRRPRR